jgi:hypothetical protein
MENPSIKNHLQDSAKTGYNGVVSETAAASSMNGSISDCLNLEFDNQVFSVRGTFCKSGQLNVEVSALGMKIDRIDVDLSKGEFCQNPSVGFAEIKYCFYQSGSCLWTKGFVDSWFSGRKEWNERIISL